MGTMRDSHQDDTKSVRRMRLKRTRQYVDEQSPNPAYAQFEGESETVKGEDLLHE